MTASTKIWNHIQTHIIVSGISFCLRNWYNQFKSYQDTTEYYFIYLKATRTSLDHIIIQLVKPVSP